MNNQDPQLHQPPATVPSSSSLPQVPQHTSRQPLFTDEEINVLRRLQESTAAALSVAQSSMDPNHPQWGSSKGTTPDTKGKGHDRSAVFDGLLPRIETRGQSKQSSKKTSGKKSKGTSYK